MRFTTTINNVRLAEWEINITQGALVDLINQASSWAKAVVIDGVTYYWMSFSKVCEELPSVFSKEDTVYRQYKVLKEKGIIEHFKMDGKDYVRLTEKGCEWNKFEPIRDSEKNPSAGNQSEQTRKKIRESSEKNPTDNNTNYKYNQDQSPLTPTGELAPAEVVLNYLNSVLADLAEQLGERKPVGFSLKPWAKNIAARIADSSVAECQQVVDYLVARWGRDDKMREYLCPKTIFRQSNFADYLPKSSAWAHNGKPICVNGKWVAPAEVAKRQISPSVDEVKAWYHKSLNAMSNPWKKLDFSDKRNLVLYHATIATKNKKPLERELLAVIGQAIKDTVERIDSLKAPQFN